MREFHHVFQAHDLVAGDAAIDFVNTVTARNAEPADWLASYDQLIGWAGQTGLFSKGDLAGLNDLARKDPVEASAALMRCKLLREALCRVLYSLIDGKEPKRSDLAVIDTAFAGAAAAGRLAVKEGKGKFVWPLERSGLDLIAHVVAARALDLLRDAKLERLRVCGGTQCGWLFLDLSKNSSRRWCDMATCGNAAKARRFQQRQRKSRPAKG